MSWEGGGLGAPSPTSLSLSFLIPRISFLTEAQFLSFFCSEWERVQTQPRHRRDILSPK